VFKKKKQNKSKANSQTVTAAQNKNGASVLNSLSHVSSEGGNAFPILNDVFPLTVLK